MGTLELQRSEATEVVVLHWRIEQLVRAGFDDDEADLLAQRRDIDLHAAMRLLRDGCSRELALQILL